MPVQHRLHIVQQPPLPLQQLLGGRGLQRDAQRRCLAVAGEQRPAIQRILAELRARKIGVDAGILQPLQLAADVGKPDRRAEQQRHLEQAVHGVHPGHLRELRAQLRNTLQHALRHQVLALRPVGDHQEILRAELGGNFAGECARRVIREQRLGRRFDAQIGDMRADDQQERQHYQETVPGPRQQQPVAQFQPSFGHRAESSSRYGIGIRHHPRHRGAPGKLQAAVRSGG